MHYQKEILLIYIQDLMTNNLINGGGTSGACRISVSSVLLVIVLLCIQVRYFDIGLEKCVRAVYLISSIERELFLHL